MNVFKEGDIVTYIGTTYQNVTHGEIIGVVTQRWNTFVVEFKDVSPTKVLVCYGGELLAGHVDRHQAYLLPDGVEFGTPIFDEFNSEPPPVPNPLYCSCNSKDVVVAWAGGEKYNYCRGCKKERL